MFAGFLVLNFLHLKCLFLHIILNHLISSETYFTFFSFLFLFLFVFSLCTEDANRTYWNLSPLQCQQQAKTKTKKTRPSGLPLTTLYRSILSSLNLTLSLSFSNLIFFQFCILFPTALAILFFILNFFDYCLICLSLSYLFYLLI